MNKQEKLREIGIYAVRNKSYTDIEFRRINDDYLITTQNTCHFNTNPDVKLILDILEK